MDRFDAMKAFVRVVETGSFTRAAATLHMSRTTVTQLVQQLEARLRLKLLNRTTRKVNVTADGAAYYERIVQVLDTLEEIETSLPHAAALPRGQLRVDVPSPLAALLLVPALPGFHALYPDIVLDMGASDRMVDVIADNVDCVIRGGDITDQSLMARKLADLPLGVYAAPAYLQRVGTPLHPLDLQDSAHRIVRFRWGRSGNGFPYVMHSEGQSVKIHGQYVLSIDDGNAYLAAGVAGLGVLWLPDYMARPHVARGELLPLFPAWTVDPMPLYLAYPPNRHVSKKLRVFIDWVAELMAQNAAHPAARPAAITATD
ncbi:LysR family transcriptional regulator [Janthinobacterium sp. HSC-3S05]|uniref:LysR family transcriptional regulator n=1 Tax=Janthinobacterium lividum TaxID=29581 RepID=UPI001CD893CE|nr:LysR family transcriptional regulator [Janthinobacterium lividum]MCA1860349.1 LysR family transcriptional regulator [Janthinobacterium lividum]